MKQAQPYDICRYILENTHESRVIYFVGEFLSRAIIREWDSELYSDGFDRLTEDNITLTKPYKLVEFLVNYAFNRDFEISVGAQQKLLSPVGVVAKLSALEEVSKIFDNPDIEQEDLCTFLKMLILNISANFAPIVPFSTYERERSRILSGLALFSVLISEFSKNDSAYDCLDIPIDYFEKVQDKFENFEWVNLFQLLITLIGRLLSESDWIALLQRDDVLTFRLVNCLELVTSIELHRKNDRRKRRGEKFCLLIDSRWESALGTASISNCLSVLMKFYALLREKEDCSQRIFTSILSVVSVRFTDRHDAYNVEHAAICMSALARSLVPLHLNPFEGISANLISTLESNMYKPLELTLDRLPPVHIRFVEIEDKFKPIGSTLRPSELPLLALICGSFLKKVQGLLRLIKKYFTDADKMSDAEILDNFSATIFYLNAAFEFLTFAKNILYSCLIVEAGVIHQVGLNQDEFQDAVMSAHEASERILGLIRDTYCSNAYRCETSVPIPLTTGKMAERDYLAYQLKQSYIQTRDFFESHLRDVVRVCIASRIAPPDGFRNDSILCRVAVDSPIQDLKYFEQSLSEIGDLTNEFEGDFVNGVFEDLRLILSNRADQWMQLGSATPKTVFDDIHQILLFLGHIFVMGSSDFGTTRGAQYTWEKQFEKTCACCVDVEDLDYDNELGTMYNYLINSITARKCDDLGDIPAFIKTFQVLFQLMAVLSKSDSSSPLLVEDMCWIFTRLVLTFFSFRVIVESGISGKNFIYQPLWTSIFLPPERAPWEFDRLKRVLVNVALSLTTSTIGILELWSGESRIVKQAEMLLFVIARHTLPLIGKTCPAIDEDLPKLVELWRKLCSAMIAIIQRTDVPSDNLIDFINACTQGAWFLRSAHNRTSEGDLFHQVLSEVYTELKPLTSGIALQNSRDRYKTLFTSGLAITRGLSRALGGIMRDSTDRLFTLSRLKISIAGVSDIPRFMWQGSFANILTLCVGPLSQEICSSLDVFQLVLSTFVEVAESVLTYLMDVPVVLTSEELAEFHQIIGGVDITLPEPHTAATQFLMLAILLCYQYRMAHFDAVTGSFMPVEEKREEELLSIFSLLESIVDFSSELSLVNLKKGLESDEVESFGGNVCFLCLGLVLPLVTIDHFKVPEISAAYFKLIYNITYDFPGSICMLFDKNLTESLSRFSVLLRFGLFQDASDTVTIRTLDTIEFILKFCLELSDLDPIRTALIEHLNLNGVLMKELFNLVTVTFPPSVELQERISQCIFALAQLDMIYLAQAAVDFMEKFSVNVHCRMKLQKNFNDFYQTVEELDNRVIRDSEKRFNAHFCDFLSTLRPHIRSN
nr:exportin 4 [Hymenolepis microstoma]